MFVMPGRLCVVLRCSHLPVALLAPGVTYHALKHHFGQRSVLLACRLRVTRCRLHVAWCRICASSCISSMPRACALQVPAGRPSRRLLFCCASSPNLQPDCRRPRQAPQPNRPSETEGHFPFRTNTDKPHMLISLNNNGETDRCGARPRCMQAYIWSKRRPFILFRWQRQFAAAPAATQGYGLLMDSLA